MPGSVTGVEAVKAAMAAFAPVVRDRAQGAIRTTASEMVRDAKDRVRVRTGALHDHIDYSFSEKSLRARVGIEHGQTTIGVTKVRGLLTGRTKGDGEIVMMDPAYYAHLVEYGHGGPHGAPPYPFMRPAFQGQLEPFDSRMTKAMQAVPDDLANIGSRFL